MDTFNFLVSVLLMMIAIQSGETWIVLAILTISIITSKELSTVIAFILSTIVLYVVIGTGNTDLLPLGIFAIIIIALFLGSKPAKQEEYAGGGMDMFGGGMGDGY